MRPLFFNFQSGPECYRTEAQNQFMLGENLLVAPVLSENEEFKRLYLPAGDWYDLNQKQFYNGRQWIIQAVPLKQIPYFVHGRFFSDAVRSAVRRRKADSRN